jgi:RecB family exonuclease
MSGVNRFHSAMRGRKAESEMIAPIIPINGGEAANGRADRRSAASTQTLPGELLSPSQISTYLGCEAKWRYKYQLDLPDPPGAGAVRGKAFHAIVEYWMRAKMAGVQLDLAGIGDVWNYAWDEAAEGAVFHAADDIETIKARGQELTVKYLAEVGPTIEPAAVEFPVTGKIGGVSVRGFVDLIDTSGRIIDLKTTGRKSSKLPAQQALQMATYVALTPGASGETRVDTLVSTKEAQLVQIEYTPGESGRRLIERLYPLAAEGMKNGLYMPNRTSVLCSRRHCNFADQCEREFGGIVE